MENSVLVIGNKPYRNLDLSNIIDSFDTNYRCNLSIPKNNNGSKVNYLALCNHLYDNLIVSNINLDNFIKRYSHAYKNKEMVEFHNSFMEHKDLYQNIFYARPNDVLYNSFLKKKGCPYFFSRQPRTGYVVVMELVLNGIKPFITNFSIYDEIRESYCSKEIEYECETHSKDDEILIVNWLHLNGYIDASLCMLKDSEGKELDERNGLNATGYIKDLINEKL